MNLLIVCVDLPRPAWGASARNYYLLKALAHGHNVSLLALASSLEKESYDYMSPLENLAHTVQVVACQVSQAKRWQQLKNAVSGKSYLLNLFLYPEMQNALDTMLARGHYDIVLFESVLMAGYNVPEGIKIIIDQHNIEHELLQRTFELEKAPFRKWYNWREGRILRKGEIERCRRANMILVTSERERQILQGLLPERVIEVVPNGVDIETFYESSSEGEISNRVIFTGTMDYYPNTNAALFFAQQCWPLIRAQIPGATWQIVGRNPPPEVQKLAELPGVTVTGTVPDVRPYLAASSVAIAPLRIGSGTRLKILEALAMRKAVVSTSIGYEGLSLVPGKHLIVVDQPEEIAQAVITLLNNTEMRRTLGSAGRVLVESEYSWQRIGDRLLHILEERELIRN